MSKYNFIILWTLLMLPSLGFSQSQQGNSLSVVLKVHFKTGEIAVPKSEEVVIENLSQVINSFPDAYVYIIGHTDSVGSDQVNLELSKGRANTIYMKSLEFGSSKDKITVKGMGESAPLATNSNQEGRRKNRRVVATFTQLNRERFIELKDTFSKIEGMTILENESSVVEKFVEKQDQKITEIKSRAVADSADSAEIEYEKESVRYLVGLGSYLNVIKTTDIQSGGKAEWLSKPNLSLNGALQFRVSNNWWIGVAAEYHLQDYEPESNPNYTWDEETPGLVKAALTTDYTNERFNLGFSINYNEEVFLEEELFVVSLNKVNFFSAFVNASYKWYDNKDFSSRFGLLVGAPISVVSDDTENYKGAFQSTFFLDFEKNKITRNTGLNFKVYYSLADFSTNENEQTESSVGLVLSLNSLSWL